jgi:hypothetical protein
VLGPKEAELRIIGCDLHGRQQTLARQPGSGALQRPDLGFHLAMIHGTIPEPENLKREGVSFTAA